MAVGREYCVYIMTNAHNTVIYTGVTNHLARRVYEHRNGLGGIFTKKYNVVKLVYYEVTDNVYAALAREKQIKGGSYGTTNKNRILSRRRIKRKFPRAAHVSPQDMQEGAFVVIQAASGIITASSRISTRRNRPALCG
jgi:putative endonuclease